MMEIIEMKLGGFEPLTLGSRTQDLTSSTKPKMCCCSRAC